MFWKAKRKAEQEPAPPVEVSKVVPKEDVSKKLAEALKAYQREFYEQSVGAANEDATAADALIDKAIDFVQDSRLGSALSITLFRHVHSWPSWSKREDFSNNYCNGPFGFIGGTGEIKSCTVVFSYKAAQYTLKFSERDTLFCDGELYGKMELHAQEQLVLGIDVSQKLGAGDLPSWTCFNVFALKPGEWMKELIEMSAYIEGERERSRKSATSEASISRARNIELPK